MKQVFPYYDIPATLRYGDKLWPEPPHVYFANMVDIGAFQRIYGPLLASPVPPSALEIVKAQEILQKAWRGDEPSLRAVIEGYDPPFEPAKLPRIGEKVKLFWTNLFRLDQPPNHTIDISTQGMTIHASDVWSFMRLAFMRDYSLGKTKVCANSDCKTPFFLQSKKGHQFCSHSCASIAGVRRWRAKQEQTKPPVHKSKKRRISR
jgi:hypothetical protein